MMKRLVTIKLPRLGAADSKGSRATARLKRQALRCRRGGRK